MFVMLMTWKFNPGTFVNSAIDQSETATESAIVASGISASSGER